MGVICNRDCINYLRNEDFESKFLGKKNNNNNTNSNKNKNKKNKKKKNSHSSKTEKKNETRMRIPSILLTTPDNQTIDLGIEPIEKIISRNRENLKVNISGNIRIVKYLKDVLPYRVDNPENARSEYNPKLFMCSEYDSDFVAKTGVKEKDVSMFNSYVKLYLMVRFPNFSKGSTELCKIEKKLRKSKYYISLFGKYEENNNTCFLFNYPGRSLRAVRKGQYFYDQDDEFVAIQFWLNVIYRICEICDYFGEEGVFFCLNPDNIRINRNGEIRVSDFTASEYRSTVYYLNDIARILVFIIIGEERGTIFASESFLSFFTPLQIELFKGFTKIDFNQMKKKYGGCASFVRETYERSGLSKMKSFQEIIEGNYIDARVEDRFIFVNLRKSLRDESLPNMEEIDLFIQLFKEKGKQFEKV